ncbi:MAG: class I SAM-dependent methyltransferase [Erysipelotrichaceae bacterium]|nr:class I SAM-dependent methyltransferase [Erysipelotrichaceae bacterium]
MNNNTFVHKYIKGLIDNNDIVADMTAGNGNDTYFLAKTAKKVYAFDISSVAINNSKERCKDLDNIEFILDSHANVDKYIKEEISLFVFNLGFLPHSDNPTITNANDTLTAFKKAYQLLKNKGYIIITFYRGHIGGKDEYYLLNDYFSTHNINILDTYRAYKSANEPITYIIKK